MTAIILGMQADFAQRELASVDRPDLAEPGPISAEIGPAPVEFAQAQATVGELGTIFPSSNVFGPSWESVGHIQPMLGRIR